MTTAIYLKEAKYEFLGKLRQRAYSLSSLGFPLVFYVLFGILMNQNWGPMRMSTYLLATYGVFGVAGVCFFGFGVGLAIERGMGWLELKQASPMPPPAYLASKLASCVLFTLVLIVLMLAIGLTFGHAQISPLQMVELLGVLIAGAIPFGAFGLVLGYIAPATSAPAVVNMIFLPMAFCSGLWIPLNFLPKMVREIAPFLPTYHLSQIAIAVIGGQHNGTALAHWEALAAFTLLFLGAAILLQRRDGSRQNSVV